MTPSILQGLAPGFDKGNSEAKGLQMPTIVHIRRAANATAHGRCNLYVLRDNMNSASCRHARKCIPLTPCLKCLQSSAGLSNVHPFWHLKDLDQERMRGRRPNYSSQLCSTIGEGDNLRCLTDFARAPRNRTRETPWKSCSDQLSSSPRRAGPHRAIPGPLRT